MKQLITAGAMALALAGCANSVAGLQEHGTTEARFPENYQEVYRRVVTMARQCQQAEVVVGIGSYKIDAQLYSELGYGEVTYALSNFQQNYYAAAKIAKDGTGTKMTISSVVEGFKAPWLRWAAGATTCNG